MLPDLKETYAGTFLMFIFMLLQFKVTENEVVPTAMAEEGELRLFKIGRIG